MDNQIQNKVITITEVSEKASQIGTMYKLKDQENKTYTLYQTKKDGQETKAYSAFKQLTKKVGATINIGYKEEPRQTQDGKPYTARTIIGIRPATAPANVSINHQAKAGIGAKDERAYWEEKDARKTDNIKWLNALNNTCLLYASSEYKKGTQVPFEIGVRSLANWLYKLEPDKEELNPPAGDYPQSGHIEDEEMEIENIPF